MGFLNSLMGIKEDSGNSGALTSSADGGHAIDKSKVLAATDSQALTPKNPGRFQSIRSLPVLEAPRYFSEEQAQALAEQARAAKRAVTSTKKAIKALNKIDDCDRKVNNVYYYKYAKKQADNELSKKRAQTSYAKHLHGQRAGYMALGAGLEQAENKAEMAIASIAASLG